MEILNYIIDNSFALIVMPLLIFAARIVDVSLGTLRIMLISKGFRKLAPLFGFLESFIWILAVSQIFKSTNNIYYYFFYAAGYATGTYVGIMIEGLLSLGMVVVRVITKYDASELVANLYSQNYNLTVTDADGEHGKVKIMFIVMKRSRLKEAIKIIKEYNPHAFYTVEDIRFVKEGKLDGPNTNSKMSMFKKQIMVRK